MTLSAGTRLGPYEVTGPLGEGGMGEVYRATDTNLGRAVAIKVLPEAFAQDAERVARFDREARTLASLNHPHIAQVHGLERSDGTIALVMELVEGPTAHHFAGLADEYYTSAVAYEPPETIVEPWEANVTASHDRESLKWRHLVDPDTPVPTPWPKQAYEAHAIQIQERRARIRAERRPESEMSALFREQQDFEVDLFRRAEYFESVGAFEGGNYLASGIFRPQMDCLMFARNPVPFCAVCRETLDGVIDLYTLRR